MAAPCGGDPTNCTSWLPHVIIATASHHNIISMPHIYLSKASVYTHSLTHTHTHTHIYLTVNWCAWDAVECTPITHSYIHTHTHTHTSIIRIHFCVLWCIRITMHKAMQISILVSRPACFKKGWRRAVIIHYCTFNNKRYVTWIFWCKQSNKRDKIIGHTDINVIPIIHY